jgi:hypothetical protein
MMRYVTAACFFWFACGSAPSPSLQTGEENANALSLGASGTWTWSDVAGTQCADGSQTGFAINPSPTGSGKVLIYMDGGGLCADENTCNGAVQTASRFSYAQADFTSEMAGTTDTTNLALFGSHTFKPFGSRGIFDRSTAQNPFQNYNYIFLPYCTADLHAGNRQDTSSAFPSVRTASGKYFKGYSNFSIFAQQIKSAFPAPASLVFTGGSAGGFGTIFNYGQLRATYPSSVPITTISDAGAPFYTGDNGFSPRQGFIMYNFEPPGVASYQEDMWADAWGLDGTCPASVQVTRTGAQRSIYPIQAIFEANVRANPNDKFGVLSGTKDRVVPYFFHLNLPGTMSPDISDGLNDFAAHVTESNVSHLFVNSSGTFNSSFVPYSQFHMYFVSDVSMWGATGSGSGTGAGITSWLTSNFTL